MISCSTRQPVSSAWVVSFGWNVDKLVYYLEGHHRRCSDLLCSNSGQLRLIKISVSKALLFNLLYIFVTKRVALHWTISSVFVAFCVYGSQTVLACS